MTLINIYILEVNTIRNKRISINSQAINHLAHILIIITSINNLLKTVQIKTRSNRPILKLKIKRENI